MFVATVLSSHCEVGLSWVLLFGPASWLLLLSICRSVFLFGWRCLTCSCLAPFNQVAIGIWAATGAFVVTAVLLIISGIDWCVHLFSLVVFCLGLSGEKKSVIWGFLVAAFLFVCFLVLLAMSMVCIAVVFELPNGYQSNLEVVYLGSYSNSNQKVRSIDKINVELKSQLGYGSRSFCHIYCCAILDR